MGAVLGIDYGDVRIGLAVTDPERKHALARDVVPARPLSDALRAILEVIARESVDQLVLGLPLRLDGEEGEQAQKTRDFAVALENATHLPLEFIDERFTSSGAHAAARMKGTHAADAEAARLILETWLDRQKKGA